MDQVAEDGERARLGVLERERDRVANAKAHAEVSRPEDSHTQDWPAIVANERREVLTEP